jgi:hypothetical protein
MDFREEYEMRLTRKVLKHVHGPCMLCERKIEYGDRISRLGKVWAEKQFEPDVRRRNVRAVRIGVAPKARSLALLEELLCEICKAELPKLRLDASAERDTELRSRAESSRRYHARMKDGS